MVAEVGGDSALSRVGDPAPPWPSSPAPIPDPHHPPLGGGSAPDPYGERTAPRRTRPCRIRADLQFAQRLACARTRSGVGQAPSLYSRRGAASGHRAPARHGRRRSSRSPPASRGSSASSARSSRATTSARRHDQRVRGRVPDPEPVRALVADAALSSAFVPVFSELLEKGERKRAWRVASSLFWLVLLGLGGLTALFILARAVDHARRSASGDSTSRSASRASSSRSSSCSGSPGSSSGSSTATTSSRVPALTPVVLEPRDHRRASSSACRTRRRRTRKLYVYAFSILIATVIQFLLPLPWLRGRDGQPAGRDRLARPGRSRRRSC